MVVKYHLSNIREFLFKGFSFQELRTLCFDSTAFRAVYERIAPSDGKQEIVADLLEYAEKTSQIETLLSVARQMNATRYEQHKPYY